MRVLFLTLLDFSSPEERGIYTDLMREFVRNGHLVYIISPTERRKRRPTEVIDRGGYLILKLRIGNIQKTNVIEKGLSTLTLESVFVKAVKRYFADVRFDLVLYSTPPITFFRAVEYVKTRDQAKTYLLLKDIFPQNAVDLGMMSKTGVRGLIYRYFRAREKRLYAVSDHIGCMSQANVDYLLAHNPEIPPAAVEVCPNSIEPVAVARDADRSRETRGKYGIPTDRTVFIYGGNLGKPQGIDFLIDCLRANRSNEDAFFVIVGSGTEFAKVERFVLDEGPPNVRLLAHVPLSEYEMLVSSCDVGLIFLDRRFTIPNFPSRLLSYMQASLPVLAATDRSTDVGRVIVEGGFGFWCESGDVEAFSRMVDSMCVASIREQMGRNARAYLEENYTVSRSYEIIMRHFR